MFENATCLQFRPHMLEQGMRTLRAYIVPILRAQIGLQSLALIPNFETNQIIVLSEWASLACARAVEHRHEYRQAIRRLDGLILDQRVIQGRAKWLGRAVISGASSN